MGCHCLLRMSFSSPWNFASGFLAALPLISNFGTQGRSWRLESGLKEAEVLDASSQRELSEKQVIGKKWTYLKRNIPQAECGPSQKARVAAFLISVFVLRINTQEWNGWIVW